MKKTESMTISNALYFEEVQRLLEEGKEVCIRVKGNSMLPFIKSGDRVLLVAYQGEPLPKGANILAKHEGNYIFHRYVGKKGDKYLLAGDGNLVLHEYIAEKDILALATRHYPTSGDETIAIDKPLYRFRGMAWYYMRIIRKIITVLKRRF
ncbi:S24/S26 family peptidase [Sphingobacterium sp. ML3W]|uniref:S24/S26 family peptidase n=1 Tax=Sphingobacterium sp. ML3W TaxID=1538644 RepID=UPI000691967F|nr:S24/S26 family peptidase [Sphingobacterium sp. ML3W]